MLVMVLSLVADGWFAPLSLRSPRMALGALAVATIAFFVMLNGRAMSKPMVIPGTGIGPTRGLVCGLLGALALVLAAHGFWTAAERPQIMEQFAVALPAVAATEASDTELARPARDAAQLVWWVEKEGGEMPSGVLPMLLGGILAIGFGLWYPQIAASASQNALGSAEKLLAPVLSLALVALGAGQQAEAAKVEADAKYIRQGMPPIVRLTPAGRETVRVLSASTLNPETAKLLQTQIDGLRLDLARYHDVQGPERAGPEYADLTKRLAEINVALRTPTDYPAKEISPDDVRQVSAAIQAIDAKVNQRTLADKASRTARCEAARVALAAAQAKNPEALQATAESLEEAYRQQRFRRAWIWVTNQPKLDDGAKTRAAATAADAEIARRNAEVEQSCEPVLTAS